MYHAKTCSGARAVVLYIIHKQKFISIACAANWYITMNEQFDFLDSNAAV